MLSTPLLTNPSVNISTTRQRMALLSYFHDLIDKKIQGKFYRSISQNHVDAKNFKNTSVIKILYNALVRSHLETNAILWNPHEAKYKLMVEKIQNKFTRFLYLKQYGVYPYYPLMYPSLFVIGMVGYCRLSVRRDVALVKYMVRVLRGELHQPAVLAALRLRAPNDYVGARRRPAMLEVPTCGSNLLKFAPMSFAVYLLNMLSENSLDIFCHNLPKLVEMAQIVTETKCL